MKKFIATLIFAILVICLLSGCSAEPSEPVAPEKEVVSEVAEEIPEPEEVVEAPIKPEEISEEPSEPEEKIDPHSFISFEEISALGLYPIWMKPNTVIIYDENGKPEIIQGGELTEEDCAKDEMYSEIGFIEPKDKTYKIRPNTKAEYYKDGFIQNI